MKNGAGKMENGAEKMENGARKMENGAGKTGSAGKLNVQMCKKNIAHKLGHPKKKSYIIYIITQWDNEKRGGKDGKRGEKDGKRGGEDGKRGGENGQRGKIKCADFAS